MESGKAKSRRTTKNALKTPGIIEWVRARNLMREAARTTEMMGDVRTNEHTIKSAMLEQT